MNSAQNKRLPRTETITVTLLVMGAKNHAKTFYNKAAARDYFLKWHKYVFAYPLVTVGGRELPTITAARRYFKIKGSRSIPWADNAKG